MKKRHNLKFVLNQQVTRLNKIAVRFWNNIKPFLAAKYWPLYLVSFCLGLYLWGPTHGWEKVRSLPFSSSHQRAKNLSTETLQKQLTRLKQELATTQRQKETPFNPNNFSRPALGQVVKGFEWIESGNSWRLHAGVDIELKPGSNILAAAAGKVTEIKEDESGAYTVTIDHRDTWKTVYANLAQVNVRQDQTVIKGAIIGTSSNIGCGSKIPSFHFSIYHQQQPVDPERMIDGLTD